ncbi:MAG TPA: periplasmic heavy metal sensor [Stellaceae bacterium]|nr:periplasmic heavy metal sensor [Stellaceae bacterium]
MSIATAGPTLTTGRPHRRLLLALLIVSVALNLFFIAGAAWTRLYGPVHRSNRDARYQQMAAELNLDPQQRIGFNRYVAAVRGRDVKMHQEIAPLIAAAWDAIGKPQADLGQVMQRFDAASQKWREFQREAMVQTLDFLALLSPAQRDEFITIQRERRAAWARHSAREH